MAATIRIPIPSGNSALGYRRDKGIRAAVPATDEPMLDRDPVTGLDILALMDMYRLNYHNLYPIRRAKPIL